MVVMFKRICVVPAEHFRPKHFRSKKLRWEISAEKFKPKFFRLAKNSAKKFRQFSVKKMFDKKVQRIWPVIFGRKIFGRFFFWPASRHPSYLKFHHVLQKF